MHYDKSIFIFIQNVTRLFNPFPPLNFSEVYRRADQLAHMLSPESHPTFAINLVNMLSQWMVWFPSDFRDESMINRSKQMVKNICLHCCKR